MQQIQTRVSFEATAPIADAILTLLNGFSKKEVQKIQRNTVVTPAENVEATQPLLSMEELYGSLKPYVSGYLSDEDIENAIAEGAIDSGMAGKADG